MANYNTLKGAIEQVIKTNGNNEITGALLQQSLIAMINSLGVGYQYVGIATPATNPGTPDQNVFYLSSTAGTYTNFDGIVLADGEIAILKYNGAWSKDSTGAATQESVNQLGQYGDDSYFIKVITDKDGKIGYGLKSDGEFIFGKGCPKQIKDAIDEKRKEYVENSESQDYCALTIDKNERVAYGINKTGKIINFTSNSQRVVTPSVSSLHLEGTQLTSGGTLLYFIPVAYHIYEFANCSDVVWKVAFSRSASGSIVISWTNPGIKTLAQNNKSIFIAPSDAKGVYIYTTSTVERENVPTIVDLGFYSKTPTTIDEKLSSVINKCVRYYFNVGIPYHYPNEDMGFVGDEETDIRPLAWIANSAAILIDSGKFDEKLAGCSLAEAKHQIRRICNNLISYHIANATGADKWGHEWQTMWWASSIASAVYLMADIFSAEEMNKCKAMIENESDWTIQTYTSVSQLYWKDKNGQVLHPGDTKGEEVSWQTNCLAIAILLGVNNAKTELYKTELIKRLVISYAKPSDSGLEYDINGYPLSLLQGSNILENGLTMNHSKYSPEYQTLFVTPLHLIPIFSKNSTKIPYAYLHNAVALSEALTNIDFHVSDGYEKPGGAMYKPSRQQVYYPNGLDWGSEMYMDKVMSDVIINSFVLNPGHDFNGFTQMHLDRIIHLQNRYETGRVFIGGDSEYRGYDSYDAVPYKRETTVSMYLAVALSALHYPLSWTDDIWTDVNKFSYSSNTEISNIFARTIVQDTDYKLIYCGANSMVVSLDTLDANDNVVEQLLSNQTVSGNGVITITPTLDASKVRLTVTNGVGVIIYFSEYLS